MTAPERGRGTWRVFQVALTLALVLFAGWHLWRQWTDAAAADYRFAVEPLWLAAASVSVLAAYALLIETWRQVLARMGAPVAFVPAARVWFVSNLGKYVPGKIWQVSAMAMMIGEYGVTLAVAGASAIVITVANVATGFAVVLLTSSATVRQLAGGTAAVVAATAGLLVLLLAAPLVTSRWNALARRRGREQLAVRVPIGAVWIAVAGTAAAWLLYGAAFWLFVRAIIGEAPGSFAAYTAAYTASYLVGYLALFAPGGIGAREIVLATVLVPLGIATPPQAAVITVASRLWLTVLEILPALAVLARRRLRGAGA